jgi:AraC-like DNA-binding protein
MTANSIIDAVDIFFLSCPIFVAAFGIILLILSLLDSRTRNEKKLKGWLVAFFVCEICSWTGMFAHFYPYVFGLEVFYFPIAALTFMSEPVVLRRFFYGLMEKKPARFEKYVQWLPGIGWMLFGVYLLYITDESYREYIVAMPYWVFYAIIASVYLSDVIRSVFAYRKEHKSDNLNLLVQMPRGWFIVFSLFAILIIIGCLIIAFGRGINIMIVRICSIAQLTQTIILISIIVKRKYALYGWDEVRYEVDEEGRSMDKEKVYEYLDKSFEELILTKKRYRDSNLHIKTVADELGVNEYYVTSFIRHKYGVTWKRYINKCRLDELRRLLELPANAKKSVVTLVRKVGFKSFQQYQRTKQAIDNNAKG